MPAPPDRTGLLGRVRWFFWKLPQAGQPLLRPVYNTRRHLGWWLLWFAVAAAAPWPFGPSPDTHVRYTGLLLELLGIGAVAAGLLGKARFGDEPGPLARARANLRDAASALRSAFTGPRTYTAHAQSVLGSVRASGTVKARVYASKNATTDHRGEVLETRLGTLEAETDELERRLKREIQEFRQALAQETRARTTDTEALRSHIGNVVAADLHIEWMGVWWLALGIVLATISPDLATP